MLGVGTKVLYKKLSIEGVIVGIVPKQEYPEQYVPEHLIAKMPKQTLDCTSYIVEILNHKFGYWVQKEDIEIVENVVDTTDRKKLKALANLLGDTIAEDSDFCLSIPAWGKTFYFGIADGVEFISNVAYHVKGD